MRRNRGLSAMYVRLISSQDAACTVDGIFDYGSHSIVIGKVEAIRIAPGFAPLVYGDGRFIPTRAAS